MSEKNRSMKFLIWQTEKIAIIAAVAPIVYVLLLNIIDGEFSLLKGIGQFLPYIYLMFGIIVFISYGFSLCKAVLPLAISMGSTRKEAVSASLFANLFLMVQVFLLYVVADFITYGNLLERINLTMAILGLLIFANAVQNVMIAFVMNTGSNYVAIIVTLVMGLLCGFAAGFFAAFFDDVNISIAGYVKWWMVLLIILVSVVLYVVSVYYMFNKMGKYKVEM